MSYTISELAQLVDIVRGIAFPTSAKQRAAAPGLIPCLRTTNVQDKVEWGDLIYVEERYVRAEAQQVRVGDILVSMSNSLNLVGKCALVTNVPQPTTFGAFIAVVRPKEGIDPRYVFHAMRSPSFKAHIRSVASTTTNISNVNSSKLLAASVPIFDGNTSANIVSKIDELFSRIEEGERALECVQKLVERYRQSVLKAAVIGELTREWRVRHKSQLESGDALLAHILDARRSAWEKAESDKMKAKGITSENDEWREKYLAPREIATDYLGPLPTEWQRVRIDTAGEVQLGRQRSPAHHTGEFMRPYLRVANVFEERIDIIDVMSMNFTPEEFRTYVLRSGDILLNEGQSKELVGRPAMYHDELPGACFTNSLVRFHATEAVLPEFAMIVFLHYMKSGYFQKIARITTNIAHLGAGRFAELSFPIPSVEEQREIVSLCERLSSVCAYLSVDVTVRRKQANGLRQSILKAAFGGNLVQQNLADESAVVLLQRVALERQTTEVTTARRGPKKKVRTA